MTDKTLSAVLRTVSSTDMQLALDWARLNKLVSSIGLVKEQDNGYVCNVYLRVDFDKFEWELKNRFGTFIRIEKGRL